MQDSECAKRRRLAAGRIEVKICGFQLTDVWLQTPYFYASGTYVLLGHMKRGRVQITRSDSSRGEWSRGDFVRNYRICSYNHLHHDGVHVHHPDHGPSVGTIRVDDARHAERTIIAYAKHDHFDLKRLRQEAKHAHRS